jgi:hypothetical protein
MSEPGFIRLKDMQNYLSELGFKGLKDMQNYLSELGFKGLKDMQDYLSEPGFKGLKDIQDYLSELGFKGLKDFQDVAMHRENPVRDDMLVEYRQFRFRILLILKSRKSLFRQLPQARIKRIKKNEIDITTQIPGRRLHHRFPVCERRIFL